VALERSGRRAVASRVCGPPALGGARRGVPDAGVGGHGTIPGALVGVEGLAEVVEDLARCAPTRVTLACADGFGAPRYGGFTSARGSRSPGPSIGWLGARTGATTTRTWW
jgi:hypothetical protein